MERLEIKVSKRQTGKRISKGIRASGFVPAVLYGLDYKPQPLSVSARELERVICTEAGWNILLELAIDDKEKVLARISDYQADVLTRALTHVDFQVISLKRKVKTAVPVRLIGKAEGVKEGGILEVVRRTIEIRCLPTEIPEHIDIDVSALKIGDSIHIEDVAVPPGTEFIADTNFSIAVVVPPAREEVPVAPAEAVPAEAAAVAAEGEAKAAAEGPKEAQAAPDKTPDKKQKEPEKKQKEPDKKQKEPEKKKE